MTKQEQIIEFLDSQNILTLATITEDGFPWATSLFYLLHGDFRLYWVSSASSLHSRNLATGKEVAATVHAATDRWKEIRGVQMWRFLRIALAQSRLYKLVPSWIRFLDNSRRFGYKCEFALPGSKDLSVEGSSAEDCSAECSRIRETLNHEPNGHRLKE